MPRGNWRFILTAIGIAIIAGLIGGVVWSDADRLQRKYERHAEHYAQAYGKSATINAQVTCRAVPAPERRSCVHQEYRQAREQQRQEYDLQAQLVTSAWTRAMGIAAIIAMVIGIVGVGLIYATFNATREANKIQSRIGEAQTRAYISVIEARVKMWREGLPQIIFTVKNAGSSPARQFIPAYEIMYLLLPTKGREAKMSPLKSSPDTFEIPASSEFELPPMSMADGFTDEVIDAFERKDGSLCIKINVSMCWKDVFDVDDAITSRWSKVVKDFEGAVCVLDRHTDVAAYARNELLRREHAHQQQA